MKVNYIHDIQTLSARDGEVYIETDNEMLIFNAETLYRDLATVVKLTLEQKYEMDKLYKTELKDIIKEL